MTEDGGLDRRGFLRLAAGAVVAGGLGGCASLVTVPAEVRNGRVRLPIRNYPELSRPGGHLRIQPAGHPTHLIVLALGSERFAVLSPVCTHQRCLVEVAGARLSCPCHGSQFDRTGRVLAGPAERALERFPAEMASSGELVIELEARAS